MILFSTSDTPGAAQAAHWASALSPQERTLNCLFQNEALTLGSVDEKVRLILLPVIVTQTVALAFPGTPRNCCLSATI